MLHRKRLNREDERLEINLTTIIYLIRTDRCEDKCKEKTTRERESEREETQLTHGTWHTDRQRLISSN